MAKSLPSRRFWIITLAVISAVVAIAVFIPNVTARVASRVLSPDGSTEAVLVAMDAGEVRGYKVCFRRPTGAPLNVKRCTEVAYLGGVSEDGVSQAIKLAWTSPSQFEIRYATAASVHVYTPVFVWGAIGYPGASGGYRNRLPAIFVRTVPNGVGVAATH
jgi:hypothetical protein